MKPSARPLANPSVVSRPGPDGEALLVNLDTAAALALNRTGHAVWRLVDGRRPVEEIVAAVRSRFLEVPETVADEVETLLDDLARDGFVGLEWEGGGQGDAGGPPAGG